MIKVRSEAQSIGGVEDLANAGYGALSSIGLTFKFSNLFHQKLKVLVGFLLLFFQLYLLND